MTLEDWLEQWEAAVAEGQSSISREEAVKRYHQDQLRREEAAEEDREHAIWAWEQQRQWHNSEKRKYNALAGNERIKADECLAQIRRLRRGEAIVLPKPKDTEKEND